jgi:hypothetical protein
VPVYEIRDPASAAAGALKASRELHVETVAERSIDLLSQKVVALIAYATGGNDVPLGCRAEIPGDDVFLALEVSIGAQAEQAPAFRDGNVGVDVESTSGLGQRRSL